MASSRICVMHCYAAHALYCILLGCVGQGPIPLSPARWVCWAGPHSPLPCPMGVLGRAPSPALKKTYFSNNCRCATRLLYHSHCRHCNYGTISISSSVMKNVRAYYRNRPIPLNLLCCHSNWFIDQLIPAQNLFFFYNNNYIILI